MDEGRGKKQSCGVDRLSSLPDSLLCQILSNLETKDVVRTRELSPRWKNLWRSVPGLEIHYDHFGEYYPFVSCVDSFLGTDCELPLHSFNVAHSFEEYVDVPEVETIRRWINTAIKRKVQHIKQVDCWDDWVDTHDAQIPESIYTCESLVSLELGGMTMASPDFVYLPSLKVISFHRVQFLDDSDFKTLILGCPVLERLSICKILSMEIGAVEVCSQSLLSFSLVVDPVEVNEDWEEDSVVTIDAPKLEYLELRDHVTASFELENCAALVKVDIDIAFNLSPGYNRGKDFDSDDQDKRDMIYNFLLEISGVKEMVISSVTLQIISDYSRYEPVPLFHNLSYLRAQLTYSLCEMLPIFLESCPNLNYIVVVGSEGSPKEGLFSVFSEPLCSLPSLEYAEIRMSVTREGMMMKQVRYFLENSPILKKLILCLDESERSKESVVLQEILSIPRRSTSCEVVIHYNTIIIDGCV